MEDGDRRIFTTGNASVIRDALSVLFEAICQEGELTAGARKRLESFAREHCDQMILDLRTSREPTGILLPGVRNFRASHVGRVLVITGEVTSPGMLRKIEALHRQHSFPARMAAGLRAFVRMAF